MCSPRRLLTKQPGDQRHDQHNENEQTDRIECRRVVGRSPAFELVRRAEAGAGQACGHVPAGGADRIADPARPDPHAEPALAHIEPHAREQGFRAAKAPSNARSPRWLARGLPGRHTI